MDEASGVTPRLKISGLAQAYNSHAVLKGVDLSIANGETVAVMGRSASGKSTLLRCVALLEASQSGECCLEGQTYLREGRELYRAAQVRSHIQMVFQEYNLFPNMTASRNITL